MRTPARSTDQTDGAGGRQSDPAVGDGRRHRLLGLQWGILIGKLAADLRFDSRRREGGM
jgi:hypothetical protein